MRSSAMIIIKWMEMVVRQTVFLNRDGYVKLIVITNRYVN